MLTRVSCRWQRCNGSCSSNEAVSIGLLVTELAINALKHALVDGRSGGMIAVGYEAAPTGWRLEVTDDGVGLPDKVSPGLGTSIVEALARQVDAVVTVSGTTQCTTVSITHGTMGARMPAAA